MFLDKERKKSQLYSAIWQSCDGLRDGIDASQYKDYVLFMVFIKYISDKSADSDDFAPPVTIPPFEFAYDDGAPHMLSVDSGGVSEDEDHDQSSENTYCGRHYRSH